jgi:hypothetical protein
MLPGGKAILTPGPLLFWAGWFKTAFSLSWLYSILAFLTGKRKTGKR